MIVLRRMAISRIAICSPSVALDIAVRVAIPKEPIADLWDAAGPLIIAETSLMGTYAGTRRSFARGGSTT